MSQKYPLSSVSIAPKKYLVITDNDQEYIIEAADDIEAGYRAINLVGLIEEDTEVKDVIPL